MREGETHEAFKISRASTVLDCRILEFPKIEDDRGALTPVEGVHDVPFEIRRVYYFYELKPGATRAGHAHKCLYQVLIAVSGAFDVTLDDGTEQRIVRLCKPNEGLYIPKMIWRHIDNFAPASVCVALASEVYEETDYYRTYSEFVADARC